MTVQEIATQVADVKPKSEAERYEDDRQFVGTILGETHEHLPNVALALAEACSKAGCCSGIACDSNCDCCV